MRVGETGVYARINGEKGENRVIALRSDMDALKCRIYKTVEYKSKRRIICVRTLTRMDSQY